MAKFQPAGIGGNAQQVLTRTVVEVQFARMEDSSGIVELLNLIGAQSALSYAKTIDPGLATQ